MSVLRDGCSDPVAFPLYFFALHALSYVLLLFYFDDMTRIDPDALATHLEVALTCAPTGTLSALHDTDSPSRRRVTYTLAQHLADRFGCFEITSGSDPTMQAFLLQEVPRAVR